MSLLFAINFNAFCDELTTQGIYLRLDSTGTQYTVVGYDPENVPTDLTLPSYYLNKPVSAIGDLAFSDCSSLQSITLTTSITAIGDQAFDGCTALTTVNIPRSVASMGDAVFTGCRNLESFTGQYAAGGGRFLVVGKTLNSFAPAGLTSVTIPATVTAIGNWAFSTCTSLKSVTIPNTVQTIGDWAFASCTKLTSIDLPTSVTSIGEAAFFSCIGLTQFSGKYASTDGRYLVDSGKLLAFAPANLTTYSIPSSVTAIGEWAFAGAKELLSITIPSTVQSIGNAAFYYCTGLTEMSIPASMTSVGSSAFLCCDNLTQFTGSNISVDGKSIIIDNVLQAVVPVGLTEMAIPSTVETIAEDAVSFSADLATLTIPASVSVIGDNAFRECESLASVTVENPDAESISLGTTVFSGVPTSTCELVVPKGSASLYSNTEQWCDFYSVDTYSYVHEFVDGVEYTGTQNYTGADASYSRTLTSGKWQAMYLPFRMRYDDWAPYGDLYKFNNVHLYDRDNDGVLEYTTLEFNKVTSGSLKPNTPYVFRPNANYSGQPVTFSTTDCDVYAAPEEEGKVSCSTTEQIFSIYGVYEYKEGLYDMNGYAFSTTGSFSLATSPETKLSPFRVYLLIRPREDAGYEDTNVYYPSRVSLSIDGEIVDDDTTDIVIIRPNGGEKDVYYDLCGRKVVNPSRGFYICNGKKVFIK